jgi:quercetin dioxygenase-like cupin family protein
MKHAQVMHLEATPGEKFRAGWERRILHTRDLMTVVIDVEGGPWAEADPLHSHPHEQISYLAEGEILFLAEGQEPVRMKTGDLFAVPSGVPHSIQLLSARARLVDTFNPIREDFLAQR